MNPLRPPLLFVISFLQPLPLVPKIFVASVSCPSCSHPNDRDFRFCQRCGYKRRQQTSVYAPREIPGPSIDMDAIKRRRQALLDKTESTSYSKQKSSLEKELSRFLVHTAPDRDITMATPDNVVNFLIWNDRTGKTVVHEENCVYIGKRSKGGCSCPKRLAFGTVDSLIVKLRSIFADWGRTLDDSAFPGYGNPAASRKVKSYLTAVREEQLLAGVVPVQAEPLFITDLAAITQDS